MPTEFNGKKNSLRMTVNRKSGNVTFSVGNPADGDRKVVATFDKDTAGELYDALDDYINDAEPDNADLKAEIAALKASLAALEARL